MKVIKSKVCFNGRYLNFKKKYFKTRKGKTEFWEYIERNKSFGPPIVIFALTPKKEVILEEIYRVPFEDWVIELPAGLQDKRGEKEKEVAERELLEETGYRAKKLLRIFQGPTNPGQSTDEAIYYLATGATREREPLHEDVEEIKVIKVPIKKLVSFIEGKSKQRKMVDCKILSILPILQEKKLI